MQVAHVITWANFLCRMHTFQNINVSLFTNQGCQVASSPEVSQILLLSMTHFHLPCFYITWYFPIFSHFYPETLVFTCQTAWSHYPEDYYICVCETVLQSTTNPSGILVNYAKSLWLGPYKSTFQVVACQTVGEFFCHERPNIDDNTWLSHGLTAGEHLWIQQESTQWTCVLVDISSQGRWSARKEVDNHLAFLTLPLKSYQWNTRMETCYGAWIMKSNNHDWIISDWMTYRHNGKFFLYLLTVNTFEI